LRQVSGEMISQKSSENGAMSFEGLCQAVKDYTLLDTERLHSLWGLVNDINHRGITGDIVECGSYRGGSSAVLRAGMGPHRKLWIYDSFQGLPETSEQDSEEAQKWISECAASMDDVLEILAATGATREEFVIREGWFLDTFKQALPKQVALLHCDADWYESVTLVLETFYPLMPNGACIILDDFGHWEGCRMAFYDFCEKYSERPLLERVGYTQAFWIRGKEHNRNG
jgi:O-methyltransferase